MYGEDCFKYLNGDFAIVIYDKSKKQFLISRDRFGNKPLYYNYYKNTLLISSEIKTIKKLLEDVTFSPNLALAEKFIFNNSLPLKDNTFINEIKPFSPSHVFKFNVDGKLIETKNFWNIQNLEFNFRKDIKYDFINSLIENSINSRTNCIFDKYALFLSGGLDSSTLLNILRNSTNKEITTYSLIEENNYQENENIDYFIKNLSSQNVKSVKVHESEIDHSKLYDEILSISDTPIPDFSFLASLHFTKIAKQNGQSVIFKGDGGDETFCGHQKHIYAYLSKLMCSLDFNSYFKTLFLFNGYNNKNLIHYFLASIYESFGIDIKNKIKRNSKIKKKIFNEDYEEIPFYQKIHNDNFANVYFNFIYNWIIPYVTDIEDKVCSKYNVVYRTPFTDYSLVEEMCNFGLNNIFSKGTKSVLKFNPLLNFTDKIKYEKEKRSYPGGFSNYIKKNHSSIKEFVFDTYNNFSFLNENILNLYNDSEKNGDTSKCFRIYSYLKWADTQNIS